jgi:VIT1/CCC1 family predicted Fe2+/Mn2+ transporter
MDFRDVSSVISRYAPALASVISTGSPVAGALVSLVLTAFGFDSKTSPEELVKRLATDPEAIIKLRQIELDHKQLMMSNEIEDRKSARDRELQMVGKLNSRDWIMDMIALTVIIGFFVMLGFVLIDEVNPNSNQAFFLMIGTLTGGFVTVLSYYFGGSRKNEKE